MTIQLFILACWIIFALYWMLSASSVKPIEKTTGWLSGNWYTLLFLLGYAFIVGFRPLARLGVAIGFLGSRLIPASIPLNAVIVSLLSAGLIVAIAARRTLAGNWSSEVAIKAGHELITSGLYSYVRNPIYAGILIMALGTALSFGTASAAIGYLIVVLGVYLKYSDEERILVRHFGSQYTSYKEHTRALIPFLW